MFPRRAECPRALVRSARWLLSAALLALGPKCVLCILAVAVCVRKNWDEWAASDASDLTKTSRLEGLLPKGRFAPGKRDLVARQHDHTSREAGNLRFVRKVIRIRRRTMERLADLYGQISRQKRRKLGSNVRRNFFARDLTRHGGGRSDKRDERKFPDVAGLAARPLRRQSLHFPRIRYLPLICKAPLIGAAPPPTPSQFARHDGNRGAVRGRLQSLRLPQIGSRVAHSRFAT